MEAAVEVDFDPVKAEELDFGDDVGADCLQFPFLVKPSGDLIGRLSGPVAPSLSYQRR